MPSDSSTTAARRAVQARFEQIGERFVLEVGVACLGPAGLPALGARHADATRVAALLDLRLDDLPAGRRAPAFADALGWFASHRATCRVCVPVDGDQAAAELLITVGWRSAPRCVLALPAGPWPDATSSESSAPESPPPGPAIVTARAVPAAFSAFVVDLDADPSASDACESAVLEQERANDGQYTTWVALDPIAAGRAEAPRVIGCVSLHQVGPIGAIHFLRVAPAWHSHGVDRELLAAALRAARLWTLRPVAIAAPGETDWLRLLEQTGFRRGGIIPWFERDAAAGGPGAGDGAEALA